MPALPGHAGRPRPLLGWHSGARIAPATTRARLGVLLAASVLVAACGGDGSASRSTERDPPTPTTEPAATTEPPATTTPDTTQPATTLPAPAEPACPGAPLPEGALDEIGWADVDGDGRSELWVRSGAGASALLVALVRYDEACDPAWVELDGAPVELAVGGSVANAAGVVCEASLDQSAHLTVYSASSADAEVYEIVARELRLEGDELLEVATDATTVDADDPGFGRYTGFTCGALVL